MKLRVKLFAAAKDLARADSVTIELPDNATAANLREALATQVSALETILPHALFAVDANYADDATVLTEQSDVALIPPVSGG